MNWVNMKNRKWQQAIGEKHVALERSVCGLVASERSGSASSGASLLLLSSSCSLFKLASSALRLACSSASRAKLACFCRHVYGQRKMVVFMLNGLAAQPDINSPSRS